MSFDKAVAHVRATTQERRRKFACDPAAWGKYKQEVKTQTDRRLACLKCMVLRISWNNYWHGDG